VNFPKRILGNMADTRSSICFIMLEWVYGNEEHRSAPKALSQFRAWGIAPGDQIAVEESAETAA